MLQLSNDVLAIIFGQLSFQDLATVRLLSKHCCRVGDGDLTWSYLMFLYGLHGVVPHSPRTWRDVAQAINLHRFPSVDNSNANAHGAMWIPFIRANDDSPGWMTTEKASILSETAGYQALPRRLNKHFCNATASIGIIPVDDDVETLFAIQTQLNDIMGIEIARNVVEEQIWTSGNTIGIDVFNIFPKYGGSRVIAMLIRQRIELLEADARRICVLFQVLMETCSTVVFVGKSKSSIKRWQQLVGPTLQNVEADNLATCEKVPNVLFLTENGSEDVCELLENTPLPFISWMINRTNTIGHTSFKTKGAISLKTYQLPAWINPLASVRIPASTLIAMIARAAANNFEESLWSLNSMIHVCAEEEKIAFDFYKLAMDTEIEELRRANEKNEPVPLEAVDLVQTHDHFFYASLRKFCFSLPVVCGDDVSTGLQIPESLKRSISGYFRILWRQNIVHCREFCQNVFHSVIEPVYAEFFEGNGFNNKNGLRQWYNAVEEKIKIYNKESRGMRRFDVLSELIIGELSEKMRDFCDRNPVHPFLHVADAEAALVSLREDITLTLQNFTRQQDEKLSRMQRSSALYTSSVGTQWIVQTLSDAEEHISSLHCDAELWDSLRVMKSESLLPISRDGVNFSNTLKERHALRLQKIWQLRNSENEARGRADRVSSQLDNDHCKNANEVVVHQIPSPTARQTVLSWFA